MPFKMTIKPFWAKQGEAALNLGLLEMVTDIHRRAVLLAPVDTRALVNSGIIKRAIQGYIVQFGSARVPYARRRHFENFKNPQTVGYLEKAGQSVTRGDKAKYFRNKV